jgi:hypothetical protein
VRQVIDRDTVEIDDPDQPTPPQEPVAAVGVDETAYLRAPATHVTTLATGIADLSPWRPACDIGARWASTSASSRVSAFSARRCAAGSVPGTVSLRYTRLPVTGRRRRTRGRKALPRPASSLAAGAGGS